MITVAVEVSGNRPAALEEIEDLAGHNRLYRKGTDTALYLDCPDRATAGLLALNLGLIPGVTAGIFGG